MSLGRDLRVGDGEGCWHGFPCAEAEEIGHGGGEGVVASARVDDGSFRVGGRVGVGDWRDGEPESFETEADPAGEPTNAGCVGDEHGARVDCVDC